MALNAQPSSSRWIELGLRPVLVAAMLTCLATPVAIAVERIVPGWQGGVFLAFAFLANLEGILSERLLSRQHVTGWAYLASRLAETLTLLLLLKLLNYVFLGWDRLVADAQLWVETPIEFVSVPDFYSGVPFLAMWLLSIHFSRLLSQLDVVEEQPPPDRTSPAYYMWLTQPSMAADRQEALDRVSELFIGSGIGLLILSTALRLMFPEAPVPVLAILGYFALGIVLLSQAQFSGLHLMWQAQGIPVQSHIGQRWLVWVTVFLVGLTLVALVLPTTYSVGPLRAALAVLTLVFYVVTFMLGLVMLLMAWLVSLILPNVEMPATPQLALPAAVPAAAAGGAGEPWLEMLLSGLFWLLVIGIAAYAVLRFVRERIGVAGGAGSWWARFVAWLRDLWSGWLGWGHGLQARLGRRSAGRQAGRPAAAGPGRLAWLALRRLAPRELVRYFYLSTLQRAAGAGQPRRTHQTPYEYQATLEREFPELEPDLAGLTEAFVQARYNTRPVAAEEAQAVKPLWQRVRDALRRRTIVRGDNPRP